MNDSILFVKNPALEIPKGGRTPWGKTLWGNFKRPCNSKAHPKAPQWICQIVDPQIGWKKGGAILKCGVFAQPTKNWDPPETGTTCVGPKGPLWSANPKEKMGGAQRVWAPVLVWKMGTPLNGCFGLVTTKLWPLLPKGKLRGCLFEKIWGFEIGKPQNEECVETRNWKGTQTQS